MTITFKTFPITDKTDIQENSFIKTPLDESELILLEGTTVQNEEFVPTTEKTDRKIFTGFQQKISKIWITYKRSILILISLIVLFISITLKLFFGSRMVNLGSIELILTKNAIIKPYGICVLIEACLELVFLFILGMYLLRKTSKNGSVQKIIIYLFCYFNVILFLTTSFYLVYIASSTLNLDEPLKNVTKLETILPNLVSQLCNHDTNCLQENGLQFFRLNSLSNLVILNLIYYLIFGFLLITVIQYCESLNLYTSLNIWNFTSSGIIILSLAYGMCIEANSIRTVVWNNLYMMDYIGWFVVGMIILANLLVFSIWFVYRKTFSIDYKHLLVIFFASFFGFISGIIRIGLQWNQDLIVNREYLNYFNRNYGAYDRQKYTSSWDQIQTGFKCCAFNGPNDYLNTSWISQVKVGIPISCCSLNHTQVCKNYSSIEISKLEGIHSNGCLNLLPKFYVQVQFRMLAVLTILSLFTLLTFMRSMVFKYKYSVFIALILHLITAIILITTGILGIKFVQNAINAEKIFGEAGILMIISGCIIMLQISFIGFSLKWGKKSSLIRMAYMCPIFISGMLLVISCKKITTYKNGLEAFETQGRSHLRYFMSLQPDQKTQLEVYEAVSFWQIVVSFTCYTFSLIYSSIWHEVILQSRPNL